MCNYPDPSDICAVITTFRPDASISECLNSIHSQVGFSVIVDDSGEQSVRLQLQTWLRKRSDVLVHHQTHNSGIACALNTGVKIAISRGFRWVLTLDDDSVAAPRMVASLITALRRIPESVTVGVVGMDWTYRSAGRSLPETVIPAWSEKRGIITSGSMFSVEHFAQIGGFREDFFIDAVDYDFCLRARKQGLAVIKVNQIGFTHTLGEPIYRQFLGAKIVSSNHSPIRLYYFFRNSTVLAAEYLCSDPLYALAVLRWYVQISFKVLLFEEDRYHKFKAIARGLWHGLFRRLGSAARAGASETAALQSQLE